MRYVCSFFLLISIISCSDLELESENFVGMWDVLGVHSILTDSVVYEGRVIYTFADGGVMKVETTYDFQTIGIPFIKPDSDIYSWHLIEGENVILFQKETQGEPANKYKELIWDVKYFDKQYLEIEVRDYYDVFVQEIVLEKLN